jgi:hypothetical protein
VKCFGRFLIVIALLAACSHNPVAPEKKSYYSGTIPIAKGNTWVYQHYYSNVTSYFSTTQQVQYRNGLYTISIGVIDSFILGGDSVVFTIAAVDSGVGYVYNNIVIITDSNFVFVNREAKSCLLTNNTLFVKDTGTGLWKTDSNGSFLSYKVPPDSSFSVPPYGESRNSSDYTRHSYSAIVTINSQNTGKYYTTEIAESQHFDGFITNIDDMLRWIENTGLFYKSNYGYFGVGAPYNVTINENYSLISFNGTLVSISQ